ncbi:PTS fructose transporter subunit IIA, partial [Oleiphilus sp. HI0071]
SSKKKVLEHVAETIATKIPDLPEHSLFENLVARERLGSTGIGQGIAIPHSRMGECTQVIGALFVLKEQVAFDAIDNLPVDLLFVLIVPKEASSEHLELLSQIAERFNDTEFCNQLREADNDTALYSLMTS